MLRRAVLPGAEHATVCRPICVATFWACIAHSSPYRIPHANLLFLLQLRDWSLLKSTRVSGSAIDSFTKSGHDEILLRQLPL